MSHLDPSSESRTAAVGRKRPAPKTPENYSVANDPAESDTDDDIYDPAGPLTQPESKQSKHKIQRTRSPDSSSGETHPSIESGEISTSESDSKESGELSDASRRSRSAEGVPHSPNGHPHRSRADYDASDIDSETDSKSASMSISSDDDEDDEDAYQPPNSYSDDLLCLKDVSEQEQSLQYRYFRVRDPYTPVYCLCCGARGHVGKTCRERVCPHCGASELHAPTACPSIRKCAHCRKVGHDSRDCTNPRYSGPVCCDVCNEDGHVEEECSRLWCVEVKRNYDHVRKIESDFMHRVCYRCGDSGPDAHWGDDCPMYHRTALTSAERNLNTTWSAKHADHFIFERMKRSPPREGSREHSPKTEDQNREPERNWQTSLLDSLLDDHRD